MDPTYLWIAIALALCGVVSALITHLRGGSAGGGFVLGALFGIIGVIAVTLIKPLPRVTKTPALPPVV